MTPTARAQVGYVAGVAAVTAGAGWEWGPPWALIVGGVITAVSFLLLADVDDGGEQ